LHSQIFNDYLCLSFAAVRYRLANNTARHNLSKKRIFINLNEDFVMAHKTTPEEAKAYEDHLKHWRSWGSWFSWGSPVGLGLFFISIAFTIWLLSQAFGWN